MPLLLPHWPKNWSAEKAPHAAGTETDLYKNHTTFLELMVREEYNIIVATKTNKLIMKGVEPMKRPVRYGKPNMSNLPEPLRKQIVTQIMAAKAPNRTQMREEAAAYRKKIAEQMTAERGING